MLNKKIGKLVGFSLYQLCSEVKTTRQLFVGWANELNNCHVFVYHVTVLMCLLVCVQGVEECCKQ